MPRYYIRSQEGDGDCLAWHLQSEGYDVVLNIDESWMRPNLQGMVAHTQSPPRQSDIVIFGSSKLGQEAAEWQRNGIRVVGAAPLADTMEMDRWGFMQLCRRLGVTIPETRRFTSYDKAREFLQDEGGRWVYKPSGNQDASCTYVSRDEEDLIRMLSHFERKIKNTEFLLQRFEEGVCVSLEGWFSGTDWTEGSWSYTMETKACMPGNIGPATGCSTSTVWPCADEPRIARKLHRKFTEMLHKSQYKGPVDLNLVFGESDIFVLEPCCRFGYDAIQLWAELLNEPLGDVLHRLAEGELDTVDIDSDLVAASVRMAIPPYPSSSKEHRADGDIPVQIDAGDMRWFWPSAIRKDKEDGEYYTAPTDGIIGVMVAVGSTLDRACVEVKERATRVRVPNVMWRHDVGDGNGDCWRQLDTWGYALPPTASKLVTRAPAPDQRRSSGLGVEQPQVFLAEKR